MTALGASALMATTASQAQTGTWQGDFSRNWHQSQNWSGDAVPTEDATINTPTDFTANIDGRSASLTGNVNVGGGQDVEGIRFNIVNGGILSVGGDTGFATGRDSFATVMVRGTGSRLETNSLRIGNFGSVSLDILDGAQVVSESAVIGNEDGFICPDGSNSCPGEQVRVSRRGSGTVLISGDESALRVTGDTLAVGSQGRGELTLTDGGLVSVGDGSGTVFAGRAGNLDLSAGIINIGSPDDDTPTAPGTLDAGTVIFGGRGVQGGGPDRLVFNHTAGDYEFTAALEGPGNVQAMAGTTVLSGDSTDFTGTTEVSGGTLVVDGVLGGTLEVLDGARLGGGGTVGTTNIASGGTIAPGNSIGTMAVDGDITIAAGSTYEVEINPDLDGDLIEASGAATIEGGTVQVVKAAGTYTPGSSYTILSAEDGVDGTFDDLTQNFPFLDFSLVYDPNAVLLEVALNGGSGGVSFCDVAWTFNQCSTAEGVGSLGQGNPIFDVVAGLPDAETARFAFDQLSGEIHASAKTVLIEDSRFLREAATNRVRAAFSAVAAPAMPALSYGPEGPLPESAGATDRFAVWGHGFGSWGTWDSDGNAADLDRDIGGFFVGADAFIGDSWRLGVLTGYSRSSFNVDDRASSGDSDSYHFGVYGGSEWGALGVRLGAAYSWHDIDTDRTIAFPGFSEKADASYDAGTAQVFGELGYRFDTAVASFEPFAGLAYVNLDTDGFDEDGGEAALSVAGETTDTTFTTLGLRASTVFLIGAMPATVRGMLGWRHAFDDVTPLSTHVFAGGDDFLIKGVPIAEDAAVLEAGLDLDLTANATFGLSYSGQIASDAQDHGLRADLSMRF